jgi:hypothetical protein
MSVNVFILIDYFSKSNVLKFYNIIFFRNKLLLFFLILTNKKFFVVSKYASNTLLKFQLSTLFSVFL